MADILVIHNTKRTAELEASRSCGECCACCVLPRVPDLDKPGYRPCEHLSQCKDGSCGIYQDRPGVCRDFLCLWRTGLVEGDERRRPDKLGLMFGIDTVGGRPYIEAWELWEGAARDYPGRGAVDWVAARTKLLVRFYGVPCSIQYPTFMGQNTLELGGRLSRMARDDPKALAKWLEEELLADHMEVPDEAALKDFYLYKHGEATQAWFDRGGRLKLPVVRQ